MKKGAVAGAIVWSAPLLTSTPAFAASTECGGGSQQCTDWYYAKVENSSCSSGGSGDGQVGGGGNGCYNLLADVGCGNTITFKNGCEFLQAAGTFSHTGTTANVTFPAGAVPLYIQIKPGPNCYTYKWNGTDGFFFYKGTDDANPGTGPAPSSDCLTNARSNGEIPATETGGKISVSIQWNSGNGCQGISHFNAYFCL